MKNNIKKVVVIIGVLAMVMSMAAFTWSGAEATVEKELRTYGFVRDYYDDNIWVADIIDYDTSDFDYVLLHGVYDMDSNILVMTTVGVNTWRNQTVVIGSAVGEFNFEDEEFTTILEWEHEDY